MSEIPSQIDFSHFMEWVFYALISGIAIYGVGILSKMQTSIESLKDQVSKLVVHHEYQEKINEEVHERLMRLEINRDTSGTN